MTNLLLQGKEIFSYLIMSNRAQRPKTGINLFFCTSEQFPTILGPTVILLRNSFRGCYNFYDFSSQTSCCLTTDGQNPTWTFPGNKPSPSVKCHYAAIPLPGRKKTPLKAEQKEAEIHNPCTQPGKLEQEGFIEELWFFFTCRWLFRAQESWRTPTPSGFHGCYKHCQENPHF